MLRGLFWDSTGMLAAGLYKNRQSYVKEISLVSQSIEDLMGI
jgi:hypothetical protein